jgi:hypothetical protein
MKLISENSSLKMTNESLTLDHKSLIQNKDQEIEELTSEETEMDSINQWGFYCTEIGSEELFFLEEISRLKSRICELEWQSPGSEEQLKQIHQLRKEKEELNHEVRNLL